MDPRGVVRGVGATGSIMVTTGEDGMSAVLLSAGQQDDWTATPDPTAGSQAKAAPTAWTGPCWLWSAAATGVSWHVTAESLTSSSSILRGREPCPHCTLAAVAKGVL
jgi:hypothetical protein